MKTQQPPSNKNKNSASSLISSVYTSRKNVLDLMKKQKYRWFRRRDRLTE